MWLTCCFLLCNADVLNRIMCSGKVTTTQIPFPTALLQVKVPVSLPPKTLHCHCVTVICDWKVNCGVVAPGAMVYVLSVIKIIYSFRSGLAVQTEWLTTSCRWS